MDGGCTITVEIVNCSVCLGTVDIRVLCRNEGGWIAVTAGTRFNRKLSFRSQYCGKNGLLDEFILNMLTKSITKINSLIVICEKLSQSEQRSSEIRHFRVVDDICNSIFVHFVWKSSMTSSYRKVQILHHVAELARMVFKVIKRLFHQKPNFYFD